MKRQLYRASVVSALFALFLLSAGWPLRATQQTSAAAPRPAPIDQQIVRDQDDMTWDDYTPIPGTTWNDPTRVASVRTIRLAILCADFPDQPFVMTLPKHSDIYGNPQVDPIKREDVVQYTQDFYAKPQPVNHGHTIHEYWMEQSRGKIGVAVTTFGPYRMSGKTYQYGFSGGMNGPVAANMPFDEKPSPVNMQTELDQMWQADAGADIRSKFDLVMRLYAGYDESSVWQEFGEMKFQTKDDIPKEFGNPDPSKPRWAKTRYVPWTSWDAAKWLWSNSAIITGEASGAIRHEVSHAAFRIGDNYNNPYVQPYRRAAAGPWDLMDRGSFNGPGGPHKRYLVPKTEGDVMSAGLMLRQRISWNFVTPDQVLTVTRSELAKSGLVVANVTARAIDPEPGFLSGVVVRLDGDAPQDKTPVEDPIQNPLWSGNPTYNFYTMEVVQRMGYDSYEPDSGVLLAKNKDQASPVGGPNSFTMFDWVIDAHPEDINKLDFQRPDGTPVMRTIADYRQLNDALFHAGANSGSAFEWTDASNHLQFYVVNVQHDARGVLSYTVAARSLDGAGPQVRGVALSGPSSGQVKAGATGTASFVLKNTGTALDLPADADPKDVRTHLFTGSDLYRLSVTVAGDGWSAALQDVLAAVKFHDSQPVRIFITRAARSASSATLTLTATSQSDPKATKTVVYKLK